MEQRQKMSDGKTAARPLAAGLAEVLLKLGNIGHGKTRTIGDEHAVPVPGSRLVDLRSEPLGNAVEQLLKQRQGQSAAGLAVRRARE